MTDHREKSASRSAEWMRNEHRINLGLMASLMKEIACIPPHGREAWLDHLRATVSRFRAHIKSRFSAEEAGEGFLQPVLDVQPMFGPQVDHLRHEHAQLIKWLDQLQEQSLRLKPDDTLLIEDFCQRIESLVKAVKHHQENEEMLVTMAFATDIGAAG